MAPLTRVEPCRAFFVGENSSTFKSGTKIVSQVDLSYVPWNGSRVGAVLAQLFFLSVFFFKLKHFAGNGNCLIIFLIWIEMKSIAFLTGNSIDSPRNVRAIFVTKVFWQSSEKRTVCNECKPLLCTDGKPFQNKWIIWNLQQIPKKQISFFLQTCG